MITEAVYVAGTRFGMGIMPGEAGRISASPVQWLVEQMKQPQMRGEAFAALPSSQNIIVTRLNEKQRKAEGASEEAQKNAQREQRDLFIAEMRAKLELAVTTSTPFYERLVDFWSNHFTVSAKKGKVAGLAGAYEREAIRPYVMGKFADMLLAVAHHPAMLIYLDNFQSIGPGSVAGMRRGKGINENLAREIMELHTLGVNGGYSQADVTNFANVITGWSIGKEDAGNPGAFEFVPRRHQPGTQYIMGQNYDDDGEAQGIAVLRYMAGREATARHIATKLARHFIADVPPAPAVEHLANVFLNSGGDLPSVYATLIDMPECWDVKANPKIKSSYDLIVSAARASGNSNEQAINYCLQSLKFLGDAPFTANSPAGFSDTVQNIAGPEAMVRRVEWAQMAARRLKPNSDALQFAENTFGPILSDTTKAAIEGAGQGPDAIAIVFASPEFQRR